jgi:hypothetical protein
LNWISGHRRTSVTLLDSSSRFFDEPDDTAGVLPEGLEHLEEIVHTTPGGRKQIKIQIAREQRLIVSGT